MTLPPTEGGMPRFLRLNVLTGEIELDMGDLFPLDLPKSVLGGVTSALGTCIEPSRERLWEFRDPRELLNELCEGTERLLEGER